MKSERRATSGAETETGSWSVAQALADQLEGRESSAMESDVSDEERSELASLLLLADHLDARMEPVCPSPAFVQSLREELVREAEHRMTRREKRHRIAVISAAVAGGIVSIASLVGGIVVLVKWLRTRAEPRQASTV